ncbi:MAG: cbb3-type cytochrome c oxidase subunit I [Porticoccaceae bacterium]
MISVTSNPVCNYKVVKQPTIMTVVWERSGCLQVYVLAAQLVSPELNLGMPYTHFGHSLTLHTNAVIFAFGGSALMAASLYVVPANLSGRIFS